MQIPFRGTGRLPVGSQPPCAGFQTIQNGGTEMKKGFSLLLVIAMIAIALTGCGGGSSKLTGTWVVDSVELDGAKFSVSELEAMGLSLIHI